GGDVGGDRLDLHAVHVAVFHPGDACLADPHRPGNLGLSQAALLAHLDQVVADVAGIAHVAGSCPTGGVVDARVGAATLIQGRVPPVVPRHWISSGGVARNRV